MAARSCLSAACEPGFPQPTSLQLSVRLAVHSLPHYSYNLSDLACLSVLVQGLWRRVKGLERLLIKGCRKVFNRLRGRQDSNGGTWSPS